MDTIRLPSRYPGEDLRPTSKKEMNGWYTYGFAAEVFVVCGIGSFIPITLEQLARENGVLLSDHTTPCTSIFGSAHPLGETMNRPVQCIIHFLGLEINTASFAMYTFSFSVLLQALLLISISAAADHGRFRKTFLLYFAFAGAIATMCFLAVTARVYYIAALLAIISNTCIGSSFVLLNSFLPLLVRHHPRISSVSSALDSSSPERDSEDDDHGTDDDYDPPRQESLDSTSSLLHNSQDAPDTTQPDKRSSSLASATLQLSTRISSNGIGIGYISAATVQILSVLIVYFTGSSSFSLRLVLFFIGSWWFLFTIPATLWLRPRPGPPLIIDKGRSSTIAYLSYAWRSLGRTIMRARRLKDVLYFLGAWFLFSDAIATVSGTAILFAKTSLGMKPAALAIINVVVMIFGVLGAFTWSRASRAMGLKPTQTILACLCVFEMIPVYALLGYLPPIKAHGNFGLQQPWEMYPLGAVYGLVLGGLSSYCRALFGELVPPGFEAAFFALYAITDKGSSIFGPAIVGAITDATGDIRPAFWFLAVLIGLPVPLMYLVDVERGKAAGAALAHELESSEREESTNSR